MEGIMGGSGTSPEDELTNKLTEALSSGDYSPALDLLKEYQRNLQGLGGGMGNLDTLKGLERSLEERLLQTRRIAAIATTTTTTSNTTTSIRDSDRDLTRTPK